MGRNSGKGHRIGVVLDRTQLYNSKTDQYIKRGENGQFLSTKSTPFKNIRKEESASAKNTEIKDKDKSKAKKKPESNK